jgi:sRNA-binding carbon storage regulator CsrA
MLSALKRTLRTRQAYKAVFGGREGAFVINDLIRKYVIASPIGDDAEITLVNVGKQRVAMEILQKVYGSDEELRKEIEKTIAETNNTQNE